MIGNMRSIYSEKLIVKYLKIFKAKRRPFQSINKELINSPGDISF